MLDQGDETVWDLVPPGFVLDFSRRYVNPVVLEGADRLRAWFENEVWDVWQGGRTAWQPEEVIDAGDMVLAFIRTGGRGKASGVEVEAHVWNLWTFRDGQPARVTYFGDDRAAALEAAGLRD